MSFYERTASLAKWVIVLLGAIVVVYTVSLWFDALIIGWKVGFANEPSVFVSRDSKSIYLAFSVVVALAGSLLFWWQKSKLSFIVSALVCVSIASVLLAFEKGLFATF